MEQAVIQAFPQVPVVIDPLRLAHNQRDALRLAQGAAAGDDFMPFALAPPQVLDFPRSHVPSLRYANGVVTLLLAEGDLPHTSIPPLAPTACMHELVAQKEENQGQGWTRQ